MTLNRGFRSLLLRPVLVGLIFLVSVSFSAPVGACSGDDLLIFGGGVFESEKLSFFEAEDFCVSEGGHLATFESESEMNNLFNVYFLETIAAGDYWWGIISSDAANPLSPSDFTFVDGDTSPGLEVLRSEPGQFPWVENEPNGDGISAPQCGFYSNINFNGQDGFKDGDCNDRKGFTCVVKGACALQFDLCLGPDLLRMFKFPATFDEHQELCQTSLGGGLMPPRSQTFMNAQIFFQVQSSGSTSLIWMGADAKAGGNNGLTTDFTFTDGTTEGLSFLQTTFETNPWGSGEPRFISTVSNDCVATEGNRLSAEACDETRPAICRVENSPVCAGRSEVPETYICNPLTFNAFDGCDCGCGGDPDCDGVQITKNCGLGGFCQNDLCVSPQPLDDSQAIEICVENDFLVIFGAGLADNRFSFDDANSACQTLFPGASLATFDSESDFARFADALSLNRANLPDQGYWIGISANQAGTGPVSPEDFSFVDNTVGGLEFLRSGAPFGLAPAGNLEDGICGFFQGGTLAADLCDEQKAFICRVPEACGASMFQCLNGNTYLLDKISEDYDSALYICNGVFGGNLVEPTTAVEFNAVGSLLSRSDVQSDAWIGINALGRGSQGVPSDFVYASNPEKDTSFFNVAPGTPPWNAGQPEIGLDCVTALDPGTIFSLLASQGCNVRLPYVCEIPETCNSPIVPETWFCDPLSFGANDGCDCGCGGIDPDCFFNDLIKGCQNPTDTCPSGVCQAAPPPPIEFNICLEPDILDAGGFSTPTVFSLAAQSCANSGSQLATFSSAAELEILAGFAQMFETSVTHVFLGITHFGNSVPNSPSDFSFIDGSTEGLQLLQGAPGEFPWAPNEPNGSPFTENCVVMEIATGLLSDVPCDFEAAFVCKNPNAFCISILPSRCYNNDIWTQVDSLLSFDEATAKCNSLGGELASPEGRLEALILSSTVFEDTPGTILDYWVGLESSVGSRGLTSDFFFSNGNQNVEDLAFVQGLAGTFPWGIGQPAVDAVSPRSCVSLKGEEGLLQVDRCDDRRAFFCVERNSCVSDVELPDDLNCSPLSIGSGDQCDCNCNVNDPDCEDPTKPVLNCPRPSTCPLDECEAIVVPPEWICAPQNFGSNDGCHCNCGAVDPDCESPRLNNPLLNCALPAVCDEGVCVAVTVPPEWVCPAELFASNSFCNCGCGANDPDCDLELFSGGGCGDFQDPSPGTICQAGVCLFEDEPVILPFPTQIMCSGQDMLVAFSGVSSFELGTIQCQNFFGDLVLPMQVKSARQLELMSFLTASVGASPEAWVGAVKDIPGAVSRPQRFGFRGVPVGQEFIQETVAGEFPWAADEPNGALGDGQDCVSLDSENGGLLSDSDCDEEKTVICSFPQICSNFLVLSCVGSQAYVFVPEVLDFGTFVNFICPGSSFASKEELQAIATLGVMAAEETVPRFFGEQLVYVGLQVVQERTNTPFDFGFIDGNRAGDAFIHVGVGEYPWAPNEPDGSGDCVVVDPKTGLLSDVNCATLAYMSCTLDASDFCTNSAPLILPELSFAPTTSPTTSPTFNPTISPTLAPTDAPSTSPTFNPTAAPTLSPTFNPTGTPTNSPTVLQPAQECKEIFAGINNPFRDEIPQR